MNETAFFLDAVHAWVWAANSGELWRTQEGGLTWVSIGSVGWQPDIWFNDSLNGWKMEATLWGLSFVQFDIDSFASTLDGGQTWEDTSPLPGSGSAFLAYPDSQTAWAIRAGFANTLEGMPNLQLPFSLHSTSDGGRTWTSHEVPLPDDGFAGESFTGGSYLPGVGNCSFESPVYSSPTIWKLALLCEDNSWMYTTANRGKTWIISSMPAGLEADIQFIDPTVGWLALGDPLVHPSGHLYQTTDGGLSWTLLRRTEWTSVQLDFLDAQTGWTVACSDSWYCDLDEGKQALEKTTDGGQTWRVLRPQVAP